MTTRESQDVADGGTALQGITTEAGPGRHELPLEGLRVVDVSNYAGGPLCAQVLAALGATVLKVERPPRGDPERDLWGEMFAAHNRGKHSVVLDLGGEGDRRTFDALVAGSDVVVENFRPETAARLGLDYPTLQGVRAGIILVSISGFGPTGPYADLPGYEMQFRALTGNVWLSREGDAGVRESWELDYPVYGYAAALFAALGVLAARSSDPDRGAHVQVPLIGAGYAWMFAALLNPVYRSMGEHRVNRVFRAADGRLLTIAAPLPAQFKTICELIGQPELFEKTGRGNFEAQYAASAEINAAIAEAVGSAPSDTWLERLQAAGIPVAPVLSPEEVWADPQLTALGLASATPRTHYRLPVIGLESRTLGAAPELDGDGDAVRRLGWAAIDPESRRT